MCVPRVLCVCTWFLMAPWSWSAKGACKLKRKLRKRRPCTCGMCVYVCTHVCERELCESCGRRRSGPQGETSEQRRYRGLMTHRIMRCFTVSLLQTGRGWGVVRVIGPLGRGRDVVITRHRVSPLVVQVEELQALAHLVHTEHVCEAQET